MTMENGYRVEFWNREGQTLVEQEATAFCVITTTTHIMIYDREQYEALLDVLKDVHSMGKFDKVQEAKKVLNL